jgi:hypothetical protein
MTAAFRLFGCTIDDAARGFRDLCGRDIEVFYLHVAASVAEETARRTPIVSRQQRPFFASVMVAVRAIAFVHR